MPTLFKMKFLGISVIIALIFFGLWMSKFCIFLVEGIGYLENNIEHYRKSGRILEGEYTVDINLLDLDSNKGKMLYDDGENQIYVSKVFAHNESDFQVYFKSSGAYSLNRATLVSGVEHLRTINGFSSILRAKAIATYGEKSFELQHSLSSGINYRDGDEFGYYLFPSVESVDINVNENPIVKVTVTNLYEYRWEKK